MRKYFEIWKTIGDIAEDFGVDYPCAAAWVWRGEVPKSYDAKFVQAALQRGFLVTRCNLDEWHDAHAKHRKQLKSNGDGEAVIECPKLTVLETTKAAE
ncbi:hypothetical protein [Falsiruegeria mediterranea]|uniref:Uncharacterized protein n=1 Tax=Falsiruegeria mediterranea M17 TaxID=1200281 RepID=A0A2R8C5F0_9RHOB|nr:hypothetical protein [Falsiruegeria mediterranea]SPJ27647.1 hypothetical protein TRM7615_01137 [Falsiruegeria mediterranea M17]